MTSFSPALTDWARKQGQYLAEAFLRDDIEERGDPAAFFGSACEKHQLLGILRDHAEPAFMSRVMELEAGHG